MSQRTVSGCFHQMSNENSTSDSDSSDESKWIRVSTAAELRGIDRQTVYYHIQKKHVRTNLIDGVVFVHRDDVEKLVLRPDAGILRREEP